MATAVRSTFDVVSWFIERARFEGEHLQPHKLQRLLFLAQAYFAMLHAGAKLMPAIFVADEQGPNEPNVQAVLPRLRSGSEGVSSLAAGVEELLDGIWRRFGHHSADHLTRLTKNCLAYRRAWGCGESTEIDHQAMQRSFVGTGSMHEPQRLVLAKLMRNQAGQPVPVKAWAPPVCPPVDRERRGV